MKEVPLQALSRTTLHPNTVVWLDLFRFFCAQIVVADHVFGWCPCNLHGPAPGPLANIGFFILSGFLIAHTIYNKLHIAGYNFTSFFIDRFSRIYPAYLGALVFIAIIDHLTNVYGFRIPPVENLTAGTFFANALMLEKVPFHFGFDLFRVAPVYGSAAQLWTIPPEWWMYMFVGCAVFSVRWAKITWWRVTALCLLAYVPTNFLIIGNVQTGIGITAVWLFGAIAYVFFHNIPLDVSNRRHVMLLMLAIVIFSFSAFMRYYMTMNAFDILAAFYVSAVFYCCNWISKMDRFNFLSGSRFKAACRFGAGYSFSIYLTHYSLNVFLHNLLSPYITFIICNLFAVGFAYLFERRYKDMAAYMHARLAAARG